MARAKRRVAKHHPERREDAADKAEGRRKPEAKHDRPARIFGASAGDDDRRERKHAGAQDRQHPRRKGERQRDKRIHIAALMIFSTESLDVSQDMRATSLPSL